MGRSTDRDENTVFNLYIRDKENGNLILEIQLDSVNLANIITCAEPGQGDATFSNNTYDDFNKVFISKKVYIPITKRPHHVDDVFLKHLKEHEVDGWKSENINLNDRLNGHRIYGDSFSSKYEVTLYKTITETGSEEYNR